MTIAIPQDRPLIAIYFCGGTGFNNGARFLEATKDNQILKETTQTYFVDASTSNHRPFNTDENTMVVGSGQGSGAHRAENAEDIRNEVPQILKNFKPGVFNILVGSASGGSGSVIINELQRALVMRDINVAAVMSGSRSTRTNIENMNKLFQSFGLVTKKYQKPSLINLRVQEHGETREKVDAMILNNLLLLTLFLSGRDDKLDITDLTHLFNYPKVTGFAPAVASLDLFINELKLDKNETLYAVGTIARPGTVTDITPVPQYQPVGFIHEDLSGIFDEISVLHWAITGNSFDRLVKELETAVAGFKEESTAHRASTLLETVPDTDDDIVV
jgi:hypothetical protein